jgi:cell division protein FtsB
MLGRLQRFDWIVSLGCLALLGYFAWHALHGPRGFEHLEALNLKADKLSAELKTAQAEKTALELRVVLMRPESVDPDMLEELARDQLELARPNELIVRTTP